MSNVMLSIKLNFIICILNREYFSFRKKKKKLYFCFYSKLLNTIYQYQRICQLNEYKICIF